MANNGNSGEVRPEKNKYKFLIVSWEALSGDLAWKLQNEGHNVEICLTKHNNDEYEGFLDKVEEWKKYVDWADIIIFDDVDFGDEADKLRKKGKAVIGGTEYTDRLENDREFGQSEMKRLGMLTLPSWDFEDYDKALEFLKENPGRYVYKPSGFVPGDWRGLLFMAKEEDGKDLYEIINHNKKSLSKKIKTFQLQKHVSGVEVGASAFFNGERFIYPISIVFEHKRLFPGDLGPMTGEMGSSMFWSEPNVLFKETTGKMEEDLRKVGYVGYIDINCIVNGRGIYPLEFTCRFGYPTISIQQEGILSEMGEFFHALANHQNFELKTKNGFQVGVVCVTPPFPYYDENEFNLYRDSSIIFKKTNFEGIHIGDIKLIDGDWKVAGWSGYDLIVTGSGTTMEEARKQAYTRIDNIILINMFYRTDIGASWTSDSDRLRTWGYLDQIEWPLKHGESKLKHAQLSQEEPTTSPL